MSVVFSTGIAVGTNAFNPAYTKTNKYIRYRRETNNERRTADGRLWWPNKHGRLSSCRVTGTFGDCWRFFPKDLSRFFGRHLFHPPPPSGSSVVVFDLPAFRPVSRGRCKLYAGQPVILYFVINSCRGNFCFTHTRISYYLNAELMNSERSPQVRIACCTGWWFVREPI